MNEVKLSGRYTRDPESRNVGQSTVVKVGFAVDNRRKNQQTQEWEDGDPIFIDLEGWNKQGEALSQFKKGSLVELNGFLKFEQWQAQDGTKRSKHVVNVREIKAIERGKGTSNNASQPKQPVKKSGPGPAPAKKSAPVNDPVDADSIPF